MRWVKFFISSIILGSLLFVLIQPVGPLPFAAGRFFNPFEGFWQNAAPFEEFVETQLELSGLQDKAEVVYDERQVPHIFAQNMEDAAYLQGYITAKDRLWQMEFQIYAASGRLTELNGRGPNDLLLKMDQQTRRQGMIIGAKNGLEVVMANDTTRKILDAYARGVNDYINELNYRDLPLEYKLLNYKPEPWTPLKTAFLLKYMANNLAARASDIENTNGLSIWGKETFDLLFPERPLLESPIIPEKEAPRSFYRRRNWNPWDFEPNPVPEAPADYSPDSLLIPTQLINQPDRNIGSNNWAISGSKSATGKPILASDPHLGLNLPSIWYEIQLHTPEMNAYGVSLPGAPGVVIGFNDSIAWGQTNAGRDVMDFYRIQFKDEKKEEYLFGGRWMKAVPKIDTFHIKGGEVFYDTVIQTHVGPVMFDENFGDVPVPLAVKWMAHEGSNEALTIFKLNHAKNYQDYLEALTHYVCPAQNFVFASASGDIAIWQQGKFVNKWDQQGRFVLDASNPAHMWDSIIPQKHNPSIINPERGFVSSANQHPADATYPYYYNGSFENYRNRRINYLLESKDTLTIDDMKAFQQDNYSVMAEDILSVMLAELDSLGLDAEEQRAASKLKSWNYMYDANKIEPTIFQKWWDNLYDTIWSDEFSAIEIPIKRPSYTTTIRFLTDSAEFRFYDNTQTPTVKENRTDLINAAFHKAIADLKEIDEDMDNWQWASYKNTQILHLTRTKSFSRYNIPIGGNRNILNATSRRHGPSWRMVVALGDTVEAYGVYPGGQSGNVGNPNSDSFIDDWAAGNYFRLAFLQNPDGYDNPGAIRQSFSPKAVKN